MTRTRALVGALALVAAGAGVWLAGHCTSPGPVAEEPARAEELARRTPETTMPPKATPVAPGVTPPNATAPAPTPAPRAPSAEAALLDEVRAKVATDPAAAEALARQSRAQFGDSPLSDERDALLVDALINQQRIGSARSETYYYYDHHRAGAYRAHLFARTGVHPTPPTPGPH